MKRVKNKLYLKFLAAIVALCCVLSAVFAVVDFGLSAYADTDNAVSEKIYWGYDEDLFGLTIYSDGEAYEASDFTRSGNFSGTQVFTSASNVPWYQYRNDIESVTVEEAAPASTAYWFAGLTGIADFTSFDLYGLDISNVTNMSYMFSGCINLIDIDLSDFLIDDLSNLANAEGMLSGLTALESILIDEGMADVMGRLDTGLGKTLYIECKAFAPKDGIYVGLEAETYNTTAAEHFNEIVEAVEATCREDGNIEHYACTVCGKAFEDADGLKEIEDVTVPADPSKHDWQQVDGKEPTATEAGYTDYEECSVCGETRNKDEIPATGSGSGSGNGTSGSTGSGTKKSISNKTVLILLCAGVALVTLMAILALILAIRKRRAEGGGKDDDGFYDVYTGDY